MKLVASLALVALLALAPCSFAQTPLLDQVASLKKSTDALNARLDASDKRQDATDAKIDALAAKVDAIVSCNCQTAKADPFAITQAAPPVQYRQACDGNSCRMVAVTPASSPGVVYSDAGSCASGNCSSAGRGGFFRRFLGR